MESVDLDLSVNLDAKLPHQTIFQPSKFLESEPCQNDLQKHQSFEKALEFPPILKVNFKKENSGEMPSSYSVTQKSVTISPLNFASTKKGEKNKESSAIESREIFMDKSVILNENEMSSKHDILRKEVNILERAIVNQDQKVF